MCVCVCGLVKVDIRLLAAGRAPRPGLCAFSDANVFINTARRKTLLTYEKVIGFSEAYRHGVLTIKGTTRSRGVIINGFNEEGEQ